MRRGAFFRAVWRVVAVPLLALTIVAMPDAKALISPPPAETATPSISGYVVGDVRYSLNAADPLRIEAVSFTITPVLARRVQVRLVSGGNVWYACAAGRDRVECATTASTLLLSSVDTLDVAASS